MKKLILFLFFILYPLLTFADAPSSIIAVSGDTSSTIVYTNTIGFVGAGVTKGTGGKATVTISQDKAPNTADYLVGTANGSLSAEIVVGTTPGGELGGTWGTPTIDDTGITLTSLTVGSLLGIDSIDATGAVDMDYGSADITDHTFVTDGGTVILDGNINSSTLTASEILITDASKNLISAAVATYPSLTELSYVKGLSSAVQTQIGGKQAYDADLTTYAGITPTANAQTLLGSTFAQMQASLSIDDLITLSGVAEGSVNLATFTGTTIADNVTNKAALQALETAVEGKQASDADLTTWAGITPGANVGTFLATPSSANLLLAITDETGTGTAVFNNSPTFADDIQLGLAGTTGILKLYSEQGATDYTASLYPNTAMTSAASFYLPVDEPAAQSFLSMSTGGVMSFIAPNAGTNIANDLEEEVTEGSLADSTIVSADIKNATIVTADLSATAGITLAQTAMTAGRSLTISTNDVLADAELYTDTKCIYWENPVATDDFKSIWYTPIAATLTGIWAESDQTVTFMLQVDDGSAADVDSVDLAPAAGVASDTALNGDATLAAGDRLDMAVTSVANTPTWCSVCFTFTYDD